MLNRIRRSVCYKYTLYIESPGGNVVIESIELIEQLCRLKGHIVITDFN
jgi:hypothetical protein